MKTIDPFQLVNPMNPQKFFQPGLLRFFLTFICCSLLTVIPANAQISLVNTGSLNDLNNLMSYTLLFDASNGGKPVNKLIVSTGTESGSAAQITGITYNGVALTLIPNTAGTGTSRNRGIWYLDNPFSTGAADIVVSGTATAFAHMRLGVASISGSAPGAAIGNVAGAASVSLNVPANDSFVFAAHASKEVAPATTADTAWNFTAANPPPAITFLNSQNFTDATTRLDSFAYSATFDPNDAADALVLMFTAESAAPTATVTWDGVPMTYVTGLLGNNPVAVYYLNNPTVLSSSAIATITRPSGGNINGIGFTIMALGTTGDVDITPTASATDTVTPLDVTLTVPNADSFVVAGFNSNAGTGGATAAAPLTTLHSGDFGSLQGAIGYEANVAAGSKTYTFTGPATQILSTAVAFAGVATPANSFSSWSIEELPVSRLPHQNPSQHPSVGC